MLIRLRQITGSKYTYTIPDLYEDDVTENDIAIAALRSRVIAEAICRYLVLYYRQLEPAQCSNTILSEYLGRLGKSLRINNATRTRLEVIRNFANSAAHFQVDGSITLEDARSCITTLYQLVEWFVNTYARTSLDEVPAALKNRGNLPEREKKEIIRRSKLIASIRETVQKTACACIVGASGSGKTELCREYTERYTYNEVFYMENARSVKDFVISIPFSVEDEHKISREELYTEKIEALHKTRSRMLLIVDGLTAEEESDYADLIPGEADNYDLIITSDRPVEGVDSVMTLPAPPEEICRSVFLEYSSKHFREDKYREQLAELFRTVDYNLHLIRMAAIYLRDKGEEELGQVCIQLRRERESNQSAYDRALHQFLNILLTDNKKLKEEERTILSFLTLIPYSGVPMELFSTSCNMVWETCHNPEKEEIPDLPAVLERLEKEGWYEKDDTLDTIRVTPMISDSLFRTLEVSFQKKEVAGFTANLMGFAENARDREAEELYEIKPYMDMLTTRGLSTDSMDLLTFVKLRSFYLVIYEKDEIDKLTERIAKELKHVRESRIDGLCGRILYQEGIAYLNFEDYENAVRKFEEAMDYHQNRLFISRKAAAIVSAYYGHALACAGETEKAVEICRQGIALRKELIGEGHSEEQQALWIGYYNLGLAYYYDGKDREAEEACREAMRLIEATEKKDGVHYSSPLHLLGQILLRRAAKGQNIDYALTDEAIRYLESAVKLRMTDRGENNFWTAQLYDYLGEAYAQKQDHVRALEYYEKERAIKGGFIQSRHMQEQMAKLDKKIEELKGCDDAN